MAAQGSLTAGHLLPSAAMRGLSMVAALGLAGLTFGCAELGDFQTNDERTYRGDVLGADVGGDFIRRGFPAGTRVELDYDPEAPDGLAGTLRTLAEPCTAAGDPGCSCVRPPSLDGARLVVIPPLVHDQLSLYDFPGGGRVRNYIYAVEADDGPLAGRGAMAFASLIHGGRVELRVVSGSGNAACAPDDCAAFIAGQCDFYGVFELEREAR